MQLLLVGAVTKIEKLPQNVTYFTYRTFNILIITIISK